MPAIRKALKTSPSKLSYHIKPLLADHLLEQTAYEGCKFFKLTEQGRFQILSEGLRPPLTGLHDIGFKFKILKQPSVQFGKPIPLAHWTKFQGWFKDSYYYRTHGCQQDILVIRPIPKGDRLPGGDPIQLREQARDRAISIAQEIAQLYDMSLGKAEDEARGEYATLDIVAEHMEASVKTPEAIIDRSWGEGEIDFRNPEAAKEYLRLPMRVAKIEGIMADMLTLQQQGNKLLVGYGEALNAHIPALVGITKVTKRLDKILSQQSIRDFIRR